MQRSHRSLSAVFAVLVANMCAAMDASALSIELKDVAPDRIERQRAAASGQLPLPGTPDTGRFAERLAAFGLKPGAPIFIRVFKEQSELELWLGKDGSFVHFATYPMCHWSGTLGPKLREGDKQTPEGFYTITSRQLHRLGRWSHALNLGFPNAFDEAHKRDGSYILLHGGCSSVGCFAMTDPVIGEIYQLATAALRAGQRHVPVHVFPFRMTDEAMQSHAESPWASFWANLKEGYDSFERTRQTPRVSVCEGRYWVQDADTPSEAHPEPTAARSTRTNARAQSMLGAIRTACPAFPATPASQEAGKADPAKRADAGVRVVETHANGVALGSDVSRDLLSSAR
jgi:murein L,D-transpeptidase YafK